MGRTAFFIDLFALELLSFPVSNQFMNLNQLKDRQVWITGASSGIGRELALIAAGAKAHLLLISSRNQALQEVGELCRQQGAGSVHCSAVDLSQPVASVDATNHLLREHTTPDFLVLNAGISQRSIVEDTDITVFSRIMNLNFFGVIYMARLVLPEMIKAGGGHIAVTSSIVGRFGFPLRSAYSASKHALQGFFETLDLECRPRGIKTTLVLPGLISTSISQNALNAHGQRNEKMDRAQRLGMNARRCALRYWKAVLKGRHQVIISGPEGIMIFLHNTVPWLYRFLARRVGMPDT